MDELLRIAEYTKNYVSALQRGLDKFAGMLPILTEQKIQSMANDKLNTSKSEFLDAVKVKMTDYLLVVELDRDNWLANAVESGADPFDMKENLNTSKNVKWSKPDKLGMRYRYLRIPIGKEKDAKPGKTDKSQELQKKINEVMNKPHFGLSKMSQMSDGTVRETQSVLTTDPSLQGLYRTRTFQSDISQQGGKSKPKWQLVMFRTMSEKSGEDSWKHPGITPNHIFRETESWLKANADAMLDTFLSTETEKLGDL